MASVRPLSLLSAAYSSAVSTTVKPFSSARVKQAVLRAIAVGLEERAAAQEVQRGAGHALQGDVVVLVAALRLGVR